MPHTWVDGESVTAAKLNGMETDIAGKQPLDTDLTALAALSPANDDIAQRKGGVWTNRTPAQVKTDLAIVATNIGDSTTVGRNVLTAVDEAAARAAIGAGTGTGTGDVAGETHAAASKTTPVDADELPLVDSAASNVLKKLTVANLKVLVNGLITTALTAYNTATATLTGKTLALGSNTVTGTLAEFNAALTGANFAQAQRIVTGSGSTAAPSIDMAVTDVYVIPSLSVNITSVTLTNTSSLTPDQPLRIVITPTATRTIALGATWFEASSLALPTSAPGTARLDLGFFWNSATSKMRFVGAV